MALVFWVFRVGGTGALSRRLLGLREGDDQPAIAAFAGQLGLDEHTESGQRVCGL